MYDTKIQKIWHWASRHVEYAWPMATVIAFFTFLMSVFDIGFSFRLVFIGTPIVFVFAFIVMFVWSIILDAIS
jgi:hypothetical protein